MAKEQTTVDKEPYRPSDPEVIKERLSDKRKLARRIRAERMKMLKPLFQRLHDDTSWRGRQKLRRKLREVYPVKSEENHDPQLWSGTFASLYTSPSLVGEFQEAFGVVSETLSKKTEERIEDGETYLPYIVVGLGAHGSIILSELTAIAPEIVTTGVGLDDSKGFGGQFLQRYGGGKAYKMNTPNTAVGEEQDKNFLGQSAPVQVSDLSPEYYATNQDVGTAIAANAFLSGISPLFGTEILRVEETHCYHENPKNGKKKVDNDTELAIHDIHTPRYRIVMKVNGKEKYVYTDVIAFASGIGNPEFRFDTNDAKTQEVIESRDVVDNTKSSTLPQLVTAEELNAYLNDPTKPDARSEIVDEDILVIGRGTSSVTSLETVFRLHGSDRGAGVVTAGNPKSVEWIVGSTPMTKETLMKELWARYYSLIDVIEEGKITTSTGYAQRLEFIEVDGKRKIKVTLSDGTERIVDRVVAATGYKNNIQKVLAPLLDGRDINEELELLLNPEADNTLMGKQVKNHDILLVGPVSLTTPDEVSGKAEYLNYPIAQAMTNFATGSVKLAHKMRDMITARVPSEVLGTGGIRYKYAFITGLTSEIRRDWSEDLDINQALKLHLSFGLTDEKFKAPAGTVFSCYIKKTSTQSENGGDHLNEYEVMISAHLGDKTQMVAMDQGDLQVILKSLNQTKFKQAMCARIDLRRVHKDIEIKLKVDKNRKIPNGGIFVGGGDF